MCSTDVSEHGNQLRICSSQLRALYARLKDEYYSKIVRNGGNQPRDFFKFIASIRAPREQMPATLNHEGHCYGGAAKYAALAQYLFSSFNGGESPFSGDGITACSEVEIFHEMNLTKYATIATFALRQRRCCLLSTI